MILLDTHVLIWLDQGSPRLGVKTLKRINTAFKAGRLAASAISFWETAMLVNKQRLEIRMNMEVWRKELLANGLHEIPIDGDTAIRAAELQNFHGDPADRMIVATALRNSATLATADQKILAWQSLSLKLNAHD